MFTGEPGFEHRETLKTASHAAAAGGVTTMVVMPETNPVIDQVALVDFIQRRARDNAIVHVHTMAAMTKGLKGEEMTEIGLLKRAGAIAFSNGKSSVANTRVMRNVLLYAKDFGALIVHHTEDPYLVVQRRDELRRGGGAARAAGRAEGGRDDHAGARRAPRRDDARALSRGDHQLRGEPRGHPQRQGAQAAGDVRRLDQPPDAERERHRPLPHLLQDAPAAAQRRTTARR